MNSHTSFSENKNTNTELNNNVQTELLTLHKPVKYRMLTLVSLTYIKDKNGMFIESINTTFTPPAHWSRKVDQSDEATMTSRFNYKNNKIKRFNAKASSVEERNKGVDQPVKKTRYIKFNFNPPIETSESEIIEAAKKEFFRISEFLPVRITKFATSNVQNVPKQEILFDMTQTIVADEIHHLEKEPIFPVDEKELTYDEVAQDTLETSSPINSSQSENEIDIVNSFLIPEFQIPLSQAPTSLVNQFNNLPAVDNSQSEENANQSNFKVVPGR